MVTKKISLYLDTSVVGGYYDKEFEHDTRLLFQNIKDGKYVAFISSLTLEELEAAPEKVRKLLNDLKYQPIKTTPECQDLANEYLTENVVGATSKDDCIHIATATINKIDVLVSWNFKHIVNIQRIRGYNSINIKNGYAPIEIRSPKEVLIYELG
jgi:predicted nucleic acid-binding protein